MKVGQRDADSQATVSDAFAGSGGNGGNSVVTGSGGVTGQDTVGCTDCSIDGGDSDIASANGGLASDATDAAGLDGGSKPDAMVDAIPVELPSRQKVTFRVTNGASAVRYVGASSEGVMGSYCSPYAITQGTTNLTLAIPYQCGCECPVPPAPGLTELLVVSPGQTKDVVWDARALETYSVERPCAPTWGPSAPPASVIYGVWQPALPGNYQVTLIVKSSVPTTCKANNEDVTCDYWSEDEYGKWQGGICDRTTTVKVTFDLPETGDVIVPVTL